VFIDRIGTGVVIAFTGNEMVEAAIIVKLTTLILILLAALLAHTAAQAAEAEPEAIDESGTNPTLLLRSASLVNQYGEIPSGQYRDPVSRFG
jgi:hypothetical protein